MGMCHDAKDAASDAGDRTRGGAQQTGSYVSQTAKAARQKAAAAAQGDGDEHGHGGELKDKVMNSLGMAGENNDGTANSAGKDTSTYKPGRDY
ncbi:hypothetical protein BAE44_0024051 [Dichanthelium oligosanthes]|uniref:Uncharacterized protein n=1 Tax=Dichanthelium oligosanthes TaxID=888268 RepID=A0A1E5UPY4_9POAL|nr:hypothetical protein BAE44_0024051 [Dichanthelium oligosanthes]